MQQPDLAPAHTGSARPRALFVYYSYTQHRRTMRRTPSVHPRSGSSGLRSAIASPSKPIAPTKVLRCQPACSAPRALEAGRCRQFALAFAWNERSRTSR